MDSNKSNMSNKIKDNVGLQQILKKWKKLANATKNSSNSISSATSSSSSSSTTSNGSKSIKFLKRTLPFSDVSGASNDVVPKGFLAVCVGKELKRFIIPTQYLGHQAFGMLLHEQLGFDADKEKIGCYSPDHCELTPSQHPQMCR